MRSDEEEETKSSSKVCFVPDVRETLNAVALLRPFGIPFSSSSPRTTTTVTKTEEEKKKKKKQRSAKNERSLPEEEEEQRRVVIFSERARFLGKSETHEFSPERPRIHHALLSRKRRKTTTEERDPHQVGSFLCFALSFFLRELTLAGKEKVRRR